MAHKQNLYRSILTIAVVISSLALFGAEKPLLTQKSKDGLVYRELFSNGDFCQVRDYFSEEHIGRRIVYFISERTIDESGIRLLIQSLIRKHCGKRQAPLLAQALKHFNSTTAKYPEHWLIQVNAPNYAEFFIAVDWIGESVAIQIKYYE